MAWTCTSVRPLAWAKWLALAGALMKSPRRRGGSIALRSKHVAESDQERAFDDGHVLVGGVPVRGEHVPVGEAESDREEFPGGARVALEDCHLRAGRERVGCGSVDDVVGVCWMVVVG